LEERPERRKGGEIWRGDLEGRGGGKGRYEECDVRKWRSEMTGWSKEGRGRIVLRWKGGRSVWREQGERQLQAPAM
jgi:hypothetical protein